MNPGQERSGSWSNLVKIVAVVGCRRDHYRQISLGQPATSETEVRKRMVAALLKSSPHGTWVATECFLRNLGSYDC